MNTFQSNLKGVLPSGALDIVGDIHGEFDALMQLLYYLGYDEYGRHPKDRRLVFVGDLCDRGPSTPLTLQWIKEQYLENRISVVLGNHEVNLLNNDAKDGSGWFFPEQREFDYPKYGNYQLIAEEEKIHTIAFLNTLPIALERDDLRIIHAAWLPDKIVEMQALGNITVIEAFRYFEEKIDEKILKQDWYELYMGEKSLYDEHARNEDYPMEYLVGMAEYDLFCSQFNPLRTLVCGKEVKANQPFYAAGKWRFTTRNRWWLDYQDQKPVVMGHYWRLWRTKGRINRLFTEKPNQWLGKANNVFCVDYSVGGRWQQRLNPDIPISFRLAALRWPEQVLLFDDGQCVKTIR